MTRRKAYLQMTEKEFIEYFSSPDHPACAAARAASDAFDIADKLKDMGASDAMTQRAYSVASYLAVNAGNLSVKAAREHKIFYNRLNKA